MREFFIWEVFPRKPLVSRLLLEMMGMILLAGCVLMIPTLLISIAQSIEYDVYTAADLAEMANRRGTFYLRNDLDLTEYGIWTPINFFGTLDGQGHTIQGVTITGYAGRREGLFALMGGTVKNLHIDVNIQETITDRRHAQRIEIGGLIGRLTGTVSRVCVSGQIQVTGDLQRGRSQAICVGGLVGHDQSGRISDCCSYADVTLTLGKKGVSYYYACGGLAGAALQIRNSYAAGQVSLIEAEEIGLREENNTYIFCGGLVGDAVDVQHSYCCNLDDADSPYDLPWNSRGTYLTREEMRQRSSYEDWDFSTIWDISPTVNDGFPFLRFSDMNLTPSPL